MAPKSAFQTAPKRLSLEQHLDRACELIDHELESLIRAEPPVPSLHEALLYGLGLDQPDRKIRGKRLRPSLCLLTAQALGAPERRALPFSLAIELMHNFALVHDDMEDGDEMRRGRPCVYRAYGPPHGINIGDYFLCKMLSALLAAPRYGLTPALTLRLLNLMSTTLDHTHIGQALDISARSCRDLTLDDYFRLVSEKTGYYLAAPMVGGALVAGAPRKVIGALECLGHSLGPLFQIQDDLIDLTEAKGRDAIGSDIREGKRSYCVVWAAQRLPVGDCNRMWRILDKPRSRTTAQDVVWCVDTFNQCGAFEAARSECARLLAQAQATLATLPQPLAGLLGEFAILLAGRKK